MKEEEATYNYWIYILACCFIGGLFSYLSSRNSLDGKLNLNTFSFTLTIILVFNTLAWFIRKKYNLHYFLICGLGWTGLVIVSLVKLVFSNPDNTNLEIIGITLISIVFATFFIGGAIYFISYPFQFLYFKLRQSFKKLD